MTSTVAPWRSVPGPAPSRPRSGGLCAIEIGPVASRAATCAPGRGITCITGPREDRRPSRISFYSAGAIIARFTRRAIASRARWTARCGSPDLTGVHCPTSRRLPRCPRIRSGRSSDVTSPMAFSSTRGRHARPGEGSVSMSAGLSTCCTRPRCRGNAETAEALPSAPPRTRRPSTAGLPRRRAGRERAAGPGRPPSPPRTSARRRRR